MRLLFVTHHRKHKVHFRSGLFAENLVARGHEVTVLCVAERERFKIVEYEQRGVRYVETPDLLWGRMRSGWDPWSVWRRSRYLRKALGRFDLVHAFETRPATIFPVKALLRRQALPLVIDWVDWWGRGGLITELRPRWYQLLCGGLETWFEEHYRVLGDSLTVIASPLKDRAVGLGAVPEHIFKITDGTEVDTFLPTDRLRYRERFGLDPACAYLGFSALDVTMDAGIALDTMRVLRESHPQARLLMTGREPEGFARMLREQGVEDLVCHLGFLPYEDLPKALACVDVFILPFPDKPANRGRWPHKLGDYMALGRPTVSNPVGDVRALFEEEAIGLLVDEYPEAFAEALGTLLDDPERAAKLGAGAREVALKRFTWEQVTDQLEACYGETLARWNG